MGAFTQHCSSRGWLVGFLGISPLKWIKENNKRIYSSLLFCFDSSKYHFLKYIYKQHYCLEWCCNIALAPGAVLLLVAQLWIVARRTGRVSGKSETSGLRIQNELCAPPHFYAARACSPEFQKCTVPIKTPRFSLFSQLYSMVWNYCLKLLEWGLYCRQETTSHTVIQILLTSLPLYQI